MKELDSKQRAFVLYAAKVLKCSSPEELDKKLQNLSEDELNNLVQSFDQLYNENPYEQITQTDSGLILPAFDGKEFSRETG